MHVEAFSRSAMRGWIFIQSVWLGQEQVNVEICEVNRLSLRSLSHRCSMTDVLSAAHGNRNTMWCIETCHSCCCMLLHQSSNIFENLIKEAKSYACDVTWWSWKTTYQWDQGSIISYLSYLTTIWNRCKWVNMMCSERHWKNIAEICVAYRFWR